MMPMPETLPVDLRPDPTGGPWSAIRARIAQWRADGRTQIHEGHAKQLLRMAGLPVPQQISADVAAPARAVVKFCADRWLHKSERGFVRLNVEPANVESEVRAMRGRAREAGAAMAAEDMVLVEEMIADGLFEWFIGCRNDRTFGPIIVIGVGGIYAELIGEPEIRMLPLTAAEIARVIRGHAAWPIISGARGKPAADIARLAEVVVGIATFYWNTCDLVDEMDLNPLIVRPHFVGENVIIADAVLVLR
jgi:succinyl-CoA synthetase beta subunit